MRTIYREIVAGLVTSKDGKFLFGMKHPQSGGVYVDCWHTPGGGVEEGETHLDALHREMAEELGINVHEATVTLFDDEGHGESKKTLQDSGEVVLCKMNFYVYRILYDQNAEDITIVAGDDLEKLAWVDNDKLATYKLTPPSLELFKRHGFLPS